jgi:hypothetical protein
MPGLPNRASASLNASTQNLAVSVFDSRQGSVDRSSCRAVVEHEVAAWPSFVSLRLVTNRKLTLKSS